MEQQVRNPGTVVELGGKKYVMPPITIGAIERDTESFKALAEGRVGANQLSYVADLIVESLRRNYPELERGAVAENIDVGNIGFLTACLMKGTDLVREIDPTAEPQAEPATTAAA